MQLTGVLQCYDIRAFKRARLYFQCICWIWLLAHFMVKYHKLLCAKCQIVRSVISPHTAGWWGPNGQHHGTWCLHPFEGEFMNYSRTRWHLATERGEERRGTSASAKTEWLGCDPVWLPLSVNISSIDTTHQAGGWDRERVMSGEEESETEKFGMGWLYTVNI